MDKNYHTALEKINASESFKKNIAERMKNAQHEQRRKPRRWIPAVAAALVAAVALSVLLIPRSARHGFVLSASAADAPLSTDSSVRVGQLSWGGGAYTADHYAEEFLTDISVTGENIREITYSVTNGKLGLPDTCTRITDSTGKTAYVSDGDGSYSSEGYSYYDTVTCSYDNRFTADDQMLMASQNLSLARENGVFLRYYDAMDQLTQAYRQPIKLSEEELETIFTEYYSKVLAELKLNITVTYTDGSTETKTVAFSADCDAKPAHRRFYAYVTDADGNPHPVRTLDTSDITMSFYMTDGIDWENTEAYHKVKDIFTEDDLIEFDSYDTTVIISARLEG